MSNSLNEKFEDFVSENLDANQINEMKNAVNAKASPAEPSHLPANSAQLIGSAPVKPHEGGSSVEHDGGFENVGAKAAVKGQSKSQVNKNAGKADKAEKLKKTFVKEDEVLEDQIVEAKEEDEKEEDEKKSKTKLRKRMEEALRLVEKKKSNEEEESEEDEEEEDTQEEKKSKKMPWKESVDVSSDVNALLNGEVVSEGFADKAKTIFEAALVSKLAEHAEMVEEHYKALMEEHIEVIKEELTDKVDAFLNYVVEQWMNDNKLAIEYGLRSEIAESFINGLKGLFEEHYIEVPEEKYDIVEGMAEKLDEMELKLNEQIEKNINLNASLGGYIKNEIIAEVSQGLAETQKEKLASLAEGIEFTGEEAYREKIETIKENYFPKVQIKESYVESEPVAETQVPANMSVYVNAIDRWLGKQLNLQYYK